MPTPPRQPTAAPALQDPRLISGGGCFVHDIALDGALHAAFVSSAHAHARVAAIDPQPALAVEGVVDVITAEDLADLRVPPPNPLLADLLPVDMALLADGQLLYVGQPVAVVLARTAQAARRGAEAVWIDCEPLLPCGDHADAAPVLARVAHLGSGQTGPESEAPGARADAAEPSESAAWTVSMRQTQPRIVAMAMEPRAMTVAWDEATGGLKAWIGTQTPWRARDVLASMLGLRAQQVRVVAPDVGGAFGAKSSLGVEELVLATVAHRRRCALQWAATRSEEFTGGCHGRGMRLQATLQLDGQGRFLSLSARIDATAGAWLPYSAAVPLRNAARILPGPYRVGAVDIAGQLRRSNTAPVTIYRGAGRPEAALIMETLVERAARRCGIDPLQLRRLNLVPADQMPFTSPTGAVLDAGDYEQALHRAAAHFGIEHERAQQAQRRAAGEVVGIGCAMYVEPCGQGWESARVTLSEDGRVEVCGGGSSQGQGQAATLAAVAAQALGCAPQQVSVRLGDTAHGLPGIGALASRSTAIGGSAVLRAAQEAARRRALGEPLPIVVDEVYEAPAEAWSYGCVMLRMSIDADTGRPRIERVVWVDDAGRVISPERARGQLIGGLAQGLGQALLERIVYDEQGQLLTGSLMDYAVPRAEDMPPVELHGLHVPTQANALGAKGVGEAGCIGVPAAILNAAADALSPMGEPDLDFPLTAERLWRAMRQAPPTKRG